MEISKEAFFVWHEGMTRIVFLVGNYAIKIPNFLNQQDHFLQGCTANWVERKFCSEFKNADHDGNLYQWVAPSLFCSWFGLIQIQKRCKPYLKELTEIEKEFYYPLCGRDCKKENFGLYNGRLVCLDYP